MSNYAKMPDSRKWMVDALALMLAILGGLAAAVWMVGGGR
jgi:hypothetical protein